MTNKWLHRVTGQPVVENKRSTSFLRQVLGEADEPEKKPKKDKEPEGEPKAEPKEPAEPKADDVGQGDALDAVIDADVEAGAENGQEGSAENQAVEGMVASWQSGSKMDVASHLLYTPYSYVDFVGLIFRLGENDAADLGRLLDEMAAQRAGINQPEDAEGIIKASRRGGQDPDDASADRILAQVARHETPEASPAGETGLEHEMP